MPTRARRGYLILRTPEAPELWVRALRACPATYQVEAVLLSDPATGQRPGRREGRRGPAHRGHAHRDRRRPRAGDALAFAAPDRTWATPDSYLAVISPELATAILKRDPSQAQATADQLRLRPQDMVELGIARGIAGLVPRNPDGPTQAHDPGLSRPAPAARHSTDAGKS